jgi:hypothetical protein
MTKEAKCGEVVHTLHNHGDDVGKAEVTVESAKSDCDKGDDVRVRINDKDGELTAEYGLDDFPAGPDRYSVPGGGTLELRCPPSEQDHGKCKITFTCRWIA